MSCPAMRTRLDDFRTLPRSGLGRPNAILADCADSLICRAQDLQHLLGPRDQMALTMTASLIPTTPSEDRSDGRFGSAHDIACLPACFTQN
jgi:hypothetical protein